MSDSGDFEFQDSDYEVQITEQTRPLSVKKYLENPKELMEKILFSSFKIDPFFPVQFASIPDMMQPDTAQKDPNNMNLIEESAFRHQKLKKDVLGFLLNTHMNLKTGIKKTLPTMSQYYQQKTPTYSKYQPNPKSSSMATFLLDSKTILKQDIKKNTGTTTGIYSHNHNHNTAPVSLATQRNKIEFSSNFQCGNLFRVYQVEYNEYDLILQNDINTKGNNQWFFFLVRNVPKGLTLKLNIVNLSKKHSLFDSGMKPYIFSMIRYEKRKVGWVREGSKVNYEENDKICREFGNKPYYKLSFQYKFSHEGDVVYFSHSVPYSVSDLAKFIVGHAKNSKNCKRMKFKGLSRTLGNQDIDVIEITDEEQRERERERKKIVWIVARQHSGEVTSSFMVEGIINYLLSQNPKAKDLTRRYIFKIVPMINIDGVIHGNSRAELSGADPNRKWDNPHKLRNPVMWALKKCIEKDKGQIEMFLDLHSHSRKLGTFFYGNSFRDNRYSTRKYPWMVCKNDERFSYSDCRFSQCNPNSARHVLFQSLQIPLIYTVQSSFYGYQKQDHRIIEYLPNDYREMGGTLMSTFWEHSGFSLSLTTKMAVCEKEMLEQMEQNEENDRQSVGSNSDAGQDEFEEKQLKKLLPNFYGAKKPKKSKQTKKTKNKQKQAEKQQTPLPSKAKKNQKQSHYRIYFSGRHSCMEKRTVKQKTNIETKEIGVQVSVPEVVILKTSTNITTKVSTLLEKRSSLCIWGQKVEQEITVHGNSIGLQVDMIKAFQSREEGRKSLPSRKSFKLSSRVNSILQVKENNFLNRADCHTLPLRSSLSKR